MPFTSPMSRERLGYSKQVALVVQVRRGGTPARSRLTAGTGVPA